MTTHQPSKLDLILARLSADEANAVLEHLDGGSSTPWLAGVLQRHGYAVDERYLRKWREKRRRVREGMAA